MTQHSEFSSGYDEGFGAGVDIGKQDGIRELLAALEALIVDEEAKYESADEPFYTRYLWDFISEYRTRYPRPAAESEGDHA